MKISIIGQGYVGLPLAIAAASAGHEVVGIDRNSHLVKKLQSGASPIADVNNQHILNVLKSGKYVVADDFLSVASSEIVIICVPTPLNDAHKPDLSYLTSALTSVASILNPGTLVINESTVSPGTTRGLIAGILDNAGVAYHLAYSPERIDPANKIWNVRTTPKLVAGITEQATQEAAKFYQSFVQTVITSTSPEIIESAKLLENSFRLINISFINEFAQFCSAMKIDVLEVIAAASTKPYGFMPFYPSVGVGGHCIPVDPLYLVTKAEELGVPMTLISLANEINDSQATYFTAVASHRLKGLRDKKILLVGIAYKPDVSDIRESASVKLIESLRAQGALVLWNDDLVLEWNGENSTPISSNYDLVILANPHTGTDLAPICNVPLLDTRGSLK